MTGTNVRNASQRAVGRCKTVCETEDTPPRASNPKETSRLGRVLPLQRSCVWARRKVGAKAPSRVVPRSMNFVSFM